MSLITEFNDPKHRGMKTWVPNWLILKQLYMFEINIAIWMSIKESYVQLGGWLQLASKS